ncbi:hypothetical protein ANAPC1_00989 [Anaplasma phagocytophilum]|uniref:Uncharacterized protein n=1 Tax=Anaplasma phagocytophilum TaxID=948 RepID=A0AA45UU55_ANAPH|nr:hypothetical protein [Anaplasma phagocytophilum]SBO14628.1 hypothetical protein ANAPC1_00989 [Anaplasma phagocytophilum]
MMDIWKAIHGRHLDVFEQPEGSPSQPSTSWDQPSTSGLGATSSALYETQVVSHSPLTSSDEELEPPSKRARSA